MSQEISDLNFNSDLQNFKIILDTCNPIFPLRTHILLASHVPLHTHSLTSIMTSREKLFCLYLLCIFIFFLSVDFLLIFRFKQKKTLKCLSFHIHEHRKNMKEEKSVCVSPKRAFLASLAQFFYILDGGNGM